MINRAESHADQNMKSYPYIQPPKPNSEDSESRFWRYAWMIPIGISCLSLGISLGKYQQLQRSHEAAKPATAITVPTQNCQ